jgi:hypothetical protein
MLDASTQAAIAPIPGDHEQIRPVDPAMQDRQVQQQRMAEDEDQEQQYADCQNRDLAAGDFANHPFPLAPAAAPSRNIGQIASINLAARAATCFPAGSRDADA